MAISVIKMLSRMAQQSSQGVGEGILALPWEMTFKLKSDE